MRLLEHPNFRNLWAANTVSNFGTMFGALSLTALIYLHASPTDLGLLAAASSSPVLLIALAAGVWVDRLPRAPVMVTADLGRFVVLMTVPVAAVTGNLRMEQLYLVAFAVGCLNVIFQVAFRSALPLLVPRDRLVDANSALSVSGSVTATTSPAIGGGIAQAVGAPVGVLIDAMTFLLSALFLTRLPSGSAELRTLRRPALTEALDGLRVVLQQPALRAIFGMVLSYSFFSGFILTLYGLWIVDSLGFSALTLGLLLGSGGIGSLAGAAAAGPLARRLGLARGIVVTYVIAAALSFLTPLAAGPLWAVLVMLVAEQCLGDTFWTVHNVHALSLRQSITPEGQLGRVNAVFLVASQGLRPLGALAAGLVATILGVKAGLLISCAGINVAGLWLIFSPLLTTGVHDDTT